MFVLNSSVIKGLWQRRQHQKMQKMCANKKRKLNTLFGAKLYSFEQINFEALKKIETIHIADGGNFGGLGVYMRTLRAIKDQIVSPTYTHLKNRPLKKGVRPSSIERSRFCEF